MRQLASEFCLQTHLGQDVPQFFKTLLFAFMALRVLRANITTCSWRQSGTRAPHKSRTGDFWRRLSATNCKGEGKLLMMSAFLLLVGHPEPWD